MTERCLSSGDEAEGRQDTVRVERELGGGLEVEGWGGGEGGGSEHER